MAGRVELIHTVTTPMALYYLLVHHIPNATLIKLDNICADFLLVDGGIKYLGLNYIDKNLRVELA